MPTIAELYLAYRQAKAAHFFERRGVGLLALAGFEEQLGPNLRRLQADLAEDSWFDRLELGDTWVVPKRFRKGAADDAPGVIRIGTPPNLPTQQSLDVQLRLSPAPAFAIAEVLYLWRFGPALDGMLSRKQILGYRLDLRQQRLLPHRRWLFEYWPARYQEFRSDPLIAAKRALASGERIVIISGDFASFYDTVHPDFLLAADFVAELGAAGASAPDTPGYLRATASLLKAYERFRGQVAHGLGVSVPAGVPIGALTSRVVANVALASLDQHVSASPDLLCYRRYVDDFVIVARARKGDSTSTDVLGRFLPLRAPTADALRLDVDALARRESDFRLQKTKVRVYELDGSQGVDFVDAVISDFQRAVSESRAFIDDAALVGDGINRLVRAGKAQGSPLRVLRDADRTRLERFALSTSLRSLERASRLLDREQARGLVRRTLETVGRILDAEGSWVDDLDVTLRLLRLAIAAGDWQSARELNDRMDRTWGSIDALRSASPALFYRDQAIESADTSAWSWLCRYLHARRSEAIASVLPSNVDATVIREWLPEGLVSGTLRLAPQELQRQAELLATSDLRARDREDDRLAGTMAPPTDVAWLRAELDQDEALRVRLDAIGEFTARCAELGDDAWLLPPARLFLCTRPPSYFDIARRWLLETETTGFAADEFEHVLRIVNAVRGTDYRDPVGSVSSTRSVAIGVVDAAPASNPSNPRVILGNLVVDDSHWIGASTRKEGSAFGVPVLDVPRMQALARVLEKSSRVAKGHPSSVLVLPELSLPRRWFRAVADHVVRLERFGLVVGLEYLHDKVAPHVKNQVFAVLPGPFSSAAVWPWTKRLPAREEQQRLRELPTPVGFAPPRGAQPRTVVRSRWGTFSVLICSELIEAKRVADLLGRVNVVICPAWNKDTASYDHLIQSVGFQLHSIIAIANNGQYSDCRAWAPHTDRWRRDLCRLIERGVNDVVHVDIPLASLLAFHAGQPDPGKQWRPLPPDWSFEGYAP